MYFSRLLILALGLIASSFAIRCTDNNGKSVNWFIALRMTGANQKRVYIVMTDLKKSWTFADEEELMFPLLNQIDLTKHKAAFWSDQPPQGTVSGSYAHDKGMFFVDPATSTGF